MDQGATAVFGTPHALAAHFTMRNTDRFGSGIQNGIAATEGAIKMASFQLVVTGALFDTATVFDPR